MDEEFESTERLGEIQALLDDLAMKYEVHYHDEERLLLLKRGRSL